MKNRILHSTAAAVIFGTLLLTATVFAQSLRELETGFQNPPPAARPWVYWFSLNGNLTSNGITADLEAMARVGIGGVLYMEVDQGAPKGPADFAGPLWRELLHHACQEAHRLGLEINMNNDAGWCGSGGPWITPEFSMQKVVWTETPATGPARFAAVLAQPKAKKEYYRDIAVFAFPTPAEKYTIPHLSGKSAATAEEISPRATYAELAAQAVVAHAAMLNITDALTAEGRLTWNVPPGKWTILRLGHTTTGIENHPAPPPGLGLESDKLSKTATKVHFEGLMQKLIEDAGPLAGNVLVSMHVDSWETGSQNWTPLFRQEFQRLRGYDPLPWLPVMAGHVVDSLECSERFLWDVRMTVNDLLVENYAAYLRELAQRHGLRLSIEAYSGEPANDLMYGGRADEPMGEFWSWNKFGAANSCTEMSSVAHVYGRKILGAEAFTATDKEKWQGHPASIKDLGDWAFCEGINRFVFHRFAAQPWTDVRPGISMGPWGLHYERTQTWWEQSKAWHTYLARCQFLLQQGLFVADLCFLEPENSPQTFHSPVKSGYDRPGYNFDGCPPEIVLTRMSVKDGRIVLPDGMSYRMLVLPQTAVMSPKLLGKIKQLVADGATAVGAPPAKAPGLTHYPQSDDKVKKLVNELWGDSIAPAEITARAFGKGRIIWGGNFRALTNTAPESTPITHLAGAKWIWQNEGNPARAAPVGQRYFRRLFTITHPIQSAILTMAVDNSFECWINGKTVSDGDNFKMARTTTVAGRLKPGQNIIAVRAENGGTEPNPAGLIAALNIKYSNGEHLDILSDSQWEAAQHSAVDWKTNRTTTSNWHAALELGPPGMAPWGEINESQPGDFNDPIPNIELVTPLLERAGVPPDFSFTSANTTTGLRYIHKQIGNTDIYFVANKNPEDAEAVCTFRVTGKRPELWRPDTGHTELAAIYQSKDGVTKIPLRFEPSGSLFVIFRADAKPFDAALTFTHDGTPVDVPADRGKVEIRKARYGVLDDATQTRDVRAKVQALVDAGTFSFKAAKMAEGDDPAFGTVKTLLIEYAVDGKLLHASAYDPEIITLSQYGSASQAVAELRVDDADKFIIEATQPGRYVIQTTAGKILTATVASVPAPQEVTGPWQVAFDPRWGGPAKITFAKLDDWSQRAEDGIRFYSGTAAYLTKFRLDQQPSAQNHFLLDLGHVEVMAEIELNGHNLGILWKPPYRVDVTEALQPGENTLKIKVVNLWINRQIGDEYLPEDSDRNQNGTLKAWPPWIQTGKASPTGRFTFSSWRLWKKTDALVPSGLLGPVMICPKLVVIPR